MNNYRPQGLQGKVVSKSMEKLSSGQRINRAADDAAGSAIGLIQNPNLVRMRELIIQAVNALLTAEEHAVIKNENKKSQKK